ncbi:MAG: DJ-1/PfpI family protein [Actinobacteria bacterium]|nr:DJ-1/PfpI family protein [Actinomycetota bacterium]
MRIDIIIYEGFDELDAIGPFEVLTQAAQMGADLSTRLVTLDPAELVSASHGLEVKPHGVLDASADLVIVAGGGWAGRAERGAWGEARRGTLPTRLAKLHESGTPVAAVCTGGMLLATAGLLEGRPAVTHHSARNDLVASGAKWSDRRVVDDGDVITSGGVTSGLDLALWLVERYFGRDLRTRVAAHIEHHPTDNERVTT